MQNIFTVAGMTCQHCVNRVQIALSSVTGVHHVTVSLLPPLAIVEGDAVEAADLQAALAGSAFSIALAAAPSKVLKR